MRCKKLTAIILSLVMAVTILPGTVLAEETVETGAEMTPVADVANYGETEEDFSSEDLEAAEYVEDLIAAIGKVTVDSEAKIKSAREAYEALTQLQRSLVDNLESLEKAEAACEALLTQEGFDGLSNKRHLDGNWYYYTNGRIDKTFSGLVKNIYGWFYVKNGKVDFSFNGFAHNENGWWYLDKGKVTFKTTSVIRDTRAVIDGTKGWWYVKKSKVMTSSTTVAKNENGWWRIEKGKVNFKFKGLAKNENGWWYLKGGKVQFGYTGVASNSKGTWYVRKGKVRFDYNGIASVGHYLYCFSGGRMYRRIDKNKKMVALTYDDGPSANTATILDTLEKYSGVATFFVVGNRVSSYKSTVKRAYSMGCEIGNHTYDHQILTSVGKSSIQSQITKTNNAVRNVTGISPVVMRPPGGGYNKTVKGAVGMPVILWSIDTRDWATRNSSKTINAVMNNVKDGDIILMHDLYSQTALASKTIIPRLINDGYQLVTVSELAECRGGMSNGSVYSSFRR